MVSLQRACLVLACGWTVPGITICGFVEIYSRTVSYIFAQQDPHLLLKTDPKTLSFADPMASQVLSIQGRLFELLQVSHLTAG